jgi:hypothetical protein
VYYRTALVLRATHLYGIYNAPVRWKGTNVEMQGTGTERKDNICLWIRVFAFRDD